MSAPPSPQARHSVGSVSSMRAKRAVGLRTLGRDRDAAHHPAGDSADTLEFARVLLKRTRWQVRRDWNDALLDGDALRLEEWLGGGAAQVVKRRSHRVVYRVELPQGACYVKQSRSRGVRDFLRDLLRGNRAWREWLRLCEVAESGIAAVAPLAVGVPRVPGFSTDGYLITAAADGTEPLDQYLTRRLPAMPAAARVRARRQLARALARFVARMHQAGIEHRDFHPGNMLVTTGRSQANRPSGGTTRETVCRVDLVLVDLQAVSKQSTPLRWKQTLRNLVTLNLYFSQHASRSDRLRFWRGYLEERSALVGDAHGAARELEQRTAVAARKLWRRRDRRCVRQGRYFYRQRRLVAGGLAVRDFPAARLAQLMRDPDGPLTDVGARPLKCSSGSQVAKIEINGEGERRGAVYKRWKPRNWGEALLSWLRPSKAMHAWRMGHALVQRGIATPRPLAMVQQPTATAGICSYLLWEEIGGAQNLHEAVSVALRRGRSPEARRWLRMTTRRLALLLRRMHDLGFEHRDLKAANILVSTHETERQDQANRAAVSLHLLDLDAVGSRRHVSLDLRLRNLSRLLVSFYAESGLTRTDKLRFLDDYLPGGLAAHIDWKHLWRRLDDLAWKKIRKNQRRGRVVA